MESISGLWTVLVENDISLKSVQAFLAYLILKGHKVMFFTKLY